MTTSTRSRAGVIAVAVAALALTLAGCSDPAPEEAPATAAEKTTPAEPDPTTEKPTPTPTEVPEPADPVERLLTLHCRSEAAPNVDMMFRSLAEAWTASPELRETCETSIPVVGKMHDREIQALETAYGPGSDSLEILYSICAEPMLGDADGTIPYNEGQRAEIEGALTLCPDHADAGEVRGRMEAAAADDVLREEGKIFASGTYRVGEDVPAGTYVSESDDEPFDGCYWELLDEAGNIIDNNFLNSAFRVEITVPESAFSLSVERCGEFRPAP